MKSALGCEADQKCWVIYSTFLFSSLFKSHRKPYVCIARKNFIIGSHILFINFPLLLPLLFLCVFLSHVSIKENFCHVFECFNAACWTLNVQCWMFCYSKFQHWVAWFNFTGIDVECFSVLSLMLCLSVFSMWLAHVLSHFCPFSFHYFFHHQFLMQF